jgi:hypothetical protein
MKMRRDVQVGDVWRLNMGSICATYLMLDREGELWTVHHLERDEVDTFYDIWFSEFHPDYEKWEKLV